MPRSFPIFSSVSFSSRCLYSAYALLIVSFLALYFVFYLLINTLLFCLSHPPPFTPITLPFTQLYRFLCSSTPSLSVSTVSGKYSSCLNTFPAFDIIFISNQNQQHMWKNMLCKSDEFIFYNDYNRMKFSRWYFQENSQKDYVILVVGVFSSFVFRNHPSPFHEQLLGYSFCTFGPACRRVSYDNIIWVFWPVHFTTSATVFSGCIYPQLFSILNLFRICKTQKRVWTLNSQ